MDFDLVKVSGYCRACMEDFKDMHDLFSTNFESWTLNEILFLITGVACDASDKFSHSICSGCQVQLLEAFRFRLKVHQTYQNLKRLDIPIKVENISIEPEIVEIVPGPLHPPPPPLDEVKTEPKKKRRKRAGGRLPAQVKKDPTPKRRRGSRKKTSKKNQFLCNECGRGYDYKGRLLRHLKRFHFIQLRDFLCPLCAKFYTTKEELRTHTSQYHEGERNYSCALCDRRFALQSSLKAHMVSHSEERNFPCDQCEAKFKVKGSLRAHKQNVHLHQVPKESPNICKTCGKSYKTLQYLKNHISLIHVVEYKYKCSDCSAVFKSKKVLDAHRTEHTGEFYKCSECPKQFRLKIILKNHILAAHSGREKAYKCSLCTSEFHFGQGLNRHIKKVHKLDIDHHGLKEFSKNK